MTALPGVETRSVLLLISLWLAATPAHAQWQPNGIRLTTAEGGQDGPHIAPDESGGAIVVWRDFRNLYPTGTNSDLYAQRVTTGGIRDWATDGVPVCTDSAYQDEPDIISDGAGGAYVSWIDRRDGMTTGIDQVYLQRITSSGAISPGWTTNGIPVCPTPGDQDIPKLALDGTGGVFVVWEDYRRGRPADYYGQVDIYAQRMLPNGTVAAGWPSDGLPVCHAPGSRGLPNALADGGGGVFIEWADSRNLALSAADIYAQRLTAEGAVATGWIADGTPVCTAPGYQNLAALVTDDQGGLIVAWKDQRSAPPSQPLNDYYTDIYAQRLTAQGAIAPGWTADGMPVTTASDIQWDHKLVSDGAGGAIIVWSDYRNYNPNAADLYAQRILANGAPGWSVDGVALSQAPYWQVRPAVVPDGLGGALIAYETADHINNIYAQHVTAAGTFAPGWVPDVPVCDAPGVHYNPAAVSDGSGGMIVAWEDERDTTGFHIYAQHVAGDQPTPALVSLVSTQVELDHVVLTWFSPQRLSALVYRRTEGSDWTPLAEPRDAGDGVLVFEDRSVSEGRYAYRLGYSSGAGQVFTPEEWVSVPSGHVLALAGFHPNPAIVNPIVSFSLASKQRARLEVFDGSGRAVLGEDVGSLGPGRHTYSLSRGITWPPGVYWVRLTQGGRSVVAKGLMIR